MSFLWFGDKHRGTPDHATLADPEQFRTRTHKKLDAPDVILPYLARSGFATVARIPHIHIDTSFVMALLERWRPETHTFHFPTGECTITLEDVTMLLGLRVNGNAVAGPTEVDLDMWEEFLGVQPPRTALKGRMVLISWLKSLLANNPVNENSTVGHLTTYTKIFNLLLIGLSLMPGKTSKYVHLMWVPLLQDLDICNTYSWGSAVLAYLYREISKSKIWRKKDRNKDKVKIRDLEKQIANEKAKSSRINEEKARLRAQQRERKGALVPLADCPECKTLIAHCQYLESRIDPEEYF
ncbi:protein MAIN-LIKE 2-like [Vicia villosa]|uniref:protein MAIN-LIKE 2-like n=1 Tax=Vicia villosa TaxID=3911 RepID=UPI00273C9956|nr:protein MAIN-LIKE 2-like [Vicia villosa]